MATIDIARTLDAPVEHVFELLSDHAGYSRFRGITRSELLAEGATEPNGLGAMRRIASGPIRFEEEITAFERPVRMNYLIRRVNIPLEHQGGSIQLEPAGERTHVRWTSTFDVPVPVIGPALGALFATTIGRSFAGILDEIERSRR